MEDCTFLGADTSIYLLRVCVPANPFQLHHHHYHLRNSSNNNNASWQCKQKAARKNKKTRRVKKEGNVKPDQVSLRISSQTKLAFAFAFAFAQWYKRKRIASWPTHSVFCAESKRSGPRPAIVQHLDSFRQRVNISGNQQQQRQQE